uniref:Uncharacterized protein n=1 Tax=Cannabis sativa TaxID=3483 RepID=A0A803QRE1_CANSA
MCGILAVLGCSDDIPKHHTIISSKLPLKLLHISRSFGPAVELSTRNFGRVEKVLFANTFSFLYAFLSCVGPSNSIMEEKTVLIILLYFLGNPKPK